MVLQHIWEFRSELGIFDNFGLEKSCTMEATKILYDLNIFEIWKHVWIYWYFSDTKTLAKSKFNEYNSHN